MRKNCFIITCLICLSLYYTAAIAQVNFKPANILQSNMVLQQGQPFKLWGSAPAGDTITVYADWSSKKITVITGDDNKWLCSMAVPKAIPGRFDGHTITIIHKKDTLRLTNLLIGEVWVCSGQSNMEMSFLAWNKVKNHAAEIAAANHPNIRLLQVAHYASVTPQDEAKGTWMPCTPESVKDFSAIAYFFAREVYRHKKIPVGLVHTSWGGTVAQAWTSAEAIKKMPYFASLIEKNRNQPPIDSIPQTLDKVNQPALVYNGMIHPFLNLSIRGVLWYQGESNSNRSYQYRELFPLMINDWRKNWGIGNFPFYFVQLANFKFGTVNDMPKESSWAELQEAQLMTTALPNTGMAVINDIGDPDDIHYANKQEAGRRLALVALAKTYGENIGYSGPVYKSVKINGNTAVLSFDHIAGGLHSSTGKQLKGFAIAGDNRKFYWADARIAGDKVIVNSQQVAKPVAVRYAWANNPEVSLYNSYGLPASCFRTDDWPGMTFGLD